MNFPEVYALCMWEREHMHMFFFPEIRGTIFIRFTKVSLFEYLIYNEILPY